MKNEKKVKNEMPPLPDLGGVKLPPLPCGRVPTLWTPALERERQAEAEALAAWQLDAEEAADAAEDAAERMAEMAELQERGKE